MKGLNKEEKNNLNLFLELILWQTEDERAKTALGFIRLLYFAQSHGNNLEKYIIWNISKTSRIAGSSKFIWSILYTFRDRILKTKIFHWYFLNDDITHVGLPQLYR